MVLEARAANACRERYNEAAMIGLTSKDIKQQMQDGITQTRATIQTGGVYGKRERGTATI